MGLNSSVPQNASFQYTWKNINPKRTKLTKYNRLCSRFDSEQIRNLCLYGHRGQNSASNTAAVLAVSADI